MGTDAEINELIGRLFDEAADPEDLERFLVELEAGGYRPTVHNGYVCWEGPVPECLHANGHTTADSMRIIPMPAWPYVPPWVHVEGIDTWHANDERLCLWREGDATRQWTTLAGLLERIDIWAANAERGFAAGLGTLNTEVYWQEGKADAIAFIDVGAFVDPDEGPLLHDGHVDQFKFVPYSHRGMSYADGVVFDVKPGKFTKKTPLPPQARQLAHVRGRVLYRDRSAGLDPPTTWADFLACLTSHQAAEVEQELDRRDRLIVGFLLLWDTGEGIASLFVLQRRNRASDTWNPCVVPLRPSGKRDLLRRAGKDSSVLADKRIVVFGVGAIGSSFADLMARSGAGHLTLVDSDLLLPANLVRFAVSTALPLTTKVAAAKAVFDAAYPWTKVVTVEQSPWIPDTIKQLARGADLVVDATGDQGHAELVGRCASAVERPTVAVALFRGGSVARVRREADGDTPLWQRTHLSAYPLIPPLPDEQEYVGLETGCLAPVHNAPPTSVARAAGLAADVAIDLLTGRRREPDEIIEVLRPAGDWFDTPGRVAPSDYPVSVDLTDAARRQMIDAADAAYPNETGGPLFGVQDGDHGVITHAPEVPASHPAPHRYDLSADDINSLLAQARTSDPRIGYLGTWHSHPREGAPSSTDLRTFATVADDPATGKPVFIVVAGPAAAPPRLTAYRHTPNGVRDVTLRRSGDFVPDQDSQT